MDVECNSCHKVITIPDEKVPQASSFSFTCPYCGERVRFEASASPSVPVFSETEEAGEEPLPPVEPDSIPPGIKVAFIFATDGTWRNGAEAFFSTRGYFCVLPESVDVARAKLILQHHDVILVQDSDACAPLWKVIHSWRGVDRRGRNVILLDDDVQSLTPEDAFIRGVNACLNPADSSKLEELLESCLKGHELSLLPWEQAGVMES
jgi:hypothetical protein